MLWGKAYRSMSGTHALPQGRMRWASQQAVELRPMLSQIRYFSRITVLAEFRLS